MSNSRQHFSAATKDALVEAARELFSKHGYAGASLDSIAASASVTKGALYHHFAGKQDLFEAVFARVQAEAGAAVEESWQSVDDPWLRAKAALGAFMRLTQAPDYQRVVVQDGPSVLGYERYREREEQSMFASIQSVVRAAIEVGGWELDEEMLETFSRVFLGAISAAGQTVVTSEDPAAAGARAEAAIGFLLSGIQQLVSAGVGLPRPARTA